MSNAAFTIEQLRAEAIDDVEPLWNALREHHAALAPEFGAPRSREDSWQIRRGQYLGWLAEPGGFCLAARAADGTAAGYAFVKRNGVEPLWPTDVSAELETLSVLPAWRSSGVGAQLLTEARARVAADGIDGLSLKVLHSNVDGLRFYGRHGFDTGAHLLWGDTSA